MEDCLELDSNPEGVAEARRFVRVTLEAWELHRFIEDTELVASELVTNAVMHARSAITLSLSAVGVAGVRVEVHDENPRMPTPAACPEDATSGRGLNLVATVAAGWGTENRDGGKLVWAQIGPGRPGGPDDCASLGDVATVEDALNRFEQRHEGPLDAGGLPE